MAIRGRFFYNNDGNGCLLNGHRGPVRREMVTDEVDDLLGTPVTTLCYCLSYSEVVVYPSDVVSTAVWRETPSLRTSPGYRHVHDLVGEVLRRGWDIAAIVKDRAHEKGIEFIPSMRMNDGHFAQKVHPREHPLTSRFWMAHQDLVLNPGAEWPGPNKYWDFMLDYGHDEVRRYKLAHAFEMIDRYGEDGFELDWTRHEKYFRSDGVRPDLITDMVRQCRARLDAKGDGAGERRPLIARVPGSVERCERLGLDVVTWMQEGLVDVVAPSSPTRYISFDMPIDAWVAAAAGTGTEIHASPDSGAPRGNGHATLEMYRAAAANYYHMGAHGFYVFNLFCRGYPLADDAYMILRDVCDADALSRRDKCFCAAPPGETWRADLDNLPKELSDANRAAAVGLYVGDDLGVAGRGATLDAVKLRIRIDRVSPGDRFEVWLNDEVLDVDRAAHDASTPRKLIEWRTRTAAGAELESVTGPWVWLTFDLQGDEPIQGMNRLVVSRTTHDGSPRCAVPSLTDAEIAVIYAHGGQDRVHAAP